MLVLYLVWRIISVSKNETVNRKGITDHHHSQILRNFIANSYVDLNESMLISCLCPIILSTSDSGILEPFLSPFSQSSIT